MSRRPETKTPALLAGASCLQRLRGPNRNADLLERNDHTHAGCSSVMRMTIDRLPRG